MDAAPADWEGDRAGDEYECVDLGSPPPPAAGSSAGRGIMLGSRSGRLCVGGAALLAAGAAVCAVQQNLWPAPPGLRADDCDGEMLSHWSKPHTRGRSIEPFTPDVARRKNAWWCELYNSGNLRGLQGLYLQEVAVSVNRGSVFKGGSFLEALDFLEVLRNRFGCTNAKIVSTTHPEVLPDGDGHTVHALTCDSGSLHCDSTWKHEGNGWVIARSDITFSPGEGIWTTLGLTAQNANAKLREIVAAIPYERRRGPLGTQRMSSTSLQAVDYAIAHSGRMPSHWHKDKNVWSAGEETCRLNGDQSMIGAFIINGLSNFFGDQYPENGVYLRNTHYQVNGRDTFWCSTEDSCLINGARSFIYWCPRWKMWSMLTEADICKGYTGTFAEDDCFSMFDFNPASSDPSGPWGYSNPVNWKYWDSSSSGWEFVADHTGDYDMLCSSDLDGDAWTPYSPRAAYDADSRGCVARAPPPWAAAREPAGPLAWAWGWLGQRAPAEGERVET